MYLQYCARRCVVIMSVLELIGIIKLSYRQAEGRRMKHAVLCLKTILSLAAFGTFSLICLRESGSSIHIPLAVCAAATALISVCFRGMIRREAYLLSVGFLHTGGDGRLQAPDILSLLSAELVCLAAKWTVSAVMLSPACICLRFGIRYYSLSADRRGFMLLLAAALLLAAGGAIFAAVTRTRMCCAEYLWMSRECGGMLSAIDCSWELTSGSCGELLRLKCLSLFCGMSIASLCEMNFSKRLMKLNRSRLERGIYMEIISDSRGQQHIELAAD